MDNPFGDQRAECTGRSLVDRQNPSAGTVPALRETNTGRLLQRGWQVDQVMSSAGKSFNEDILCTSQLFAIPRRLKPASKE
jgi:hypothetical protein